MNNFLLAQNLSLNDNNVCVLKLYNDKITFGIYNEFKPPLYKWLNPAYKIDMRSGEIVKHTFFDAKRSQNNFKASLRRTLNTIYDIDKKNVFKYFVTVTFNKKYVDRKSAADCYAVYKKVIKRLKYLYGELEYLTVGEFHKDDSIHFHLMMNFLNKQPKLRFKGYTEKGNPFYTILDTFKKCDCFITVEKLITNNTQYLVKYFTKSGEFPFYRRFSCSRNLKRSRAVTSVKIPNRYFESVLNNVNKLGFNISYLDEFRCSFVLNEHVSDAPRASLDSFYKDIKGEKLIDIQGVWHCLLEKLENTKAVLDKIRYIQQGKSLLRPSLHNTQIAFDLD